MFLRLILKSIVFSFQEKKLEDLLVKVNTYAEFSFLALNK